MQVRLLGNILVLCFILVSVLVVVKISPASPDDRGTSLAQTSPCANAQESGLPLPSSFLPAKLPEFQAGLKSFLTGGKYRNLNWC